MMRSRTSGRFAPAILACALVPALFATLLLPATAWACSMAPCAPTLLSPPHLADVPSNTPAFQVRPRFWDVDPVPTPTAEWFAIESQAGVQVQFHVEPAEDALTLVLDTPLQEDTWYYLRYAEYCPGYWPLEWPLALVRPFHSVWPRTPMSEAPAVYPLSHQVEPLVVFAQSGSCVAEIQADVVRFQLGSDLLYWWHPLVRVETLVDGVRWALTEPGAPDLDGGAAGASPGHHRPTVLFHRCLGSKDDPGLAAGKHQVEVRVQVPGMAVQPAPATFEVELGCPAVAEPAQDDVTGPEVAEVTEVIDAEPEIEAMEEVADEAVPDATTDATSAAPAEASCATSPDVPSVPCAACSGCAVARGACGSPVAAVLPALCFVLGCAGGRGRPLRRARRGGPAL